MAEQAYEPRLKSEYRQRIRAAMKERFGYTNEMQIPKLDKIVVTWPRSPARSRSRPRPGRPSPASSCAKA